MAEKKSKYFGIDVDGGAKGGEEGLEVSLGKGIEYGVSLGVGESEGKDGESHDSLFPSYKDILRRPLQIFQGGPERVC